MRAPHRDPRRAVAVVLGLLVVACTASLLLGHRPVTPKELVSALHGGDPDVRALLWQLRLPRTMAAALIGAVLGLSGGLLQGATRNVLAEPGLLGIHAGAQLALLAWLLAAPVGIAASYVAPVSFAGGAAAATLVWLLVGRRGAARPGVLLLTGIAVAAALHAGTIALTVHAPYERFAQAMVWNTGSLIGVGWGEVALVACVLAVVAPAARGLAGPLDLLHLGEERAVALGVPTDRVRLVAVSTAVIGASLSTSVCGGIAFLGLLAPNLGRRIAGPRHRPLLALSACAGAVLLVVADTLARTAVASGELPTGIITAAAGAPCFLWLLVKR